MFTIGDCLDAKRRRNAETFADRNREFLARNLANAIDAAKCDCLADPDCTVTADLLKHLKAAQKLHSYGEGA